MTWHEALPDSDLVIVGKLTRDKPVRPGYGTIAVESVLLGAKTASCTLRWLPENLLAPSGVIRHHQRAGQRLIWFLQKNSDGTYRADHPCRLQKPRALKFVQREARGLIYRVLPTRHSYCAGEPVWVTIQMRTGQAKFTTSNGIELVQGGLVQRGATRLQVIDRDGLEVKGNQRTDHRSRPLHVTRHKPLLVRVDLRRHFELQPENVYRVRVGESNHEHHGRRRSRFAFIHITK